MICKILGLFANILTANDKNSVLNKLNLMQPIQLKLSNKESFFVNFFWIFEM